MAKKKVKKVACWQCKKKFKDEAAVASHASAKKHRWHLLPPKAAPLVAAPVPIASTRPTRASANTRPWNPDSPLSLRTPAIAPLTQPQGMPTTPHSPPGQPFAHDFRFKYEHPEYRNTLQEAGSSHLSNPFSRLRCAGCDTTFEAEYRLRWHMVCQNSCLECQAHHPSFVALEEHRQVGCHPSSNETVTKASLLKTSNEDDEGAPSIKMAPTSVNSSGDVDVSIPSEPTTSSVSSLPTSTDIDNTTAEGTEHGVDIDDVASVVSYASFVEITEADTVDVAMTSMGSSGAREQHVSSPSYSSDDWSAGILLTPISSSSTVLQEGPGHITDETLQAEGPSSVAGRALRPGYLVSSPSARRSVTPSLPDLSSVRSSSAMSSPSTAVPVPVSVGDHNGVTGSSEPKQRALRLHMDEHLARASPRATGDEPTPEETTNTTNAVPRGISWHCRSCERDPCDSPVATICGHIFCQGCIGREICANGCCPVCKKQFLLRLDVAM